MSTANLTKSPRPIASRIIDQHYGLHRFQHTTLDVYTSLWRSWMSTSQHKSIEGLDRFAHADFVQGTTQTFDQFVLRHAKTRTIVCFAGDFQYHACVAKHCDFAKLLHHQDLAAGQALIISLPFSALARQHPDFETILDRCDELEIPVCLDLAYWGIAKNVSVDLDAHPCVSEITCSLSKPFFTLQNHRIGVRFSRQYLDDGISMLNEVGVQNHHSMSLGMHYMQQFSCDWNWQQYQEKYSRVCHDLDLDTTDTVIFGTSHDPKYQEFNRGIQGHNRIGISLLLQDIDDEN